MAKDSVFVCLVCSGKTFESLEELSSHMSSEHEPQNMTLIGDTKCREKISDDSFLPKLNLKLVGNKLAKLSNFRVILRTPRPQTLAEDVQPSKPTHLLMLHNLEANKNRHASNLASRASKFKCSDCSKELSSAHNLERHKLVHSQEKNFVCEFCGLSFKREDNLKDHRCVVNEEGLIARVKRTRNQEEIVDTQVSLVCAICGKSFANVSNLNKHMKTHDEKREICPECGKQFHLKASLKDHIVQLHEGGKILPCPVCKKMLKGRNSLFTHLVRFHPEQKNRHSPPKHTCPDCGRVFHQSGNLRKHQLTHSENLNYVCPLCSAAFKFPEQLRRHRLRHDVSNRHSCYLCDRYFTMEYELKNHINIFHGGMSYVCKYCCMSCKHLHAFRRHLKRRHPNEEEEWKAGGLGYLKACRVANDHFVNIQANKLRHDHLVPSSEPNEEQSQSSIPNVPSDVASLADIAVDSLSELDENLASLTAPVLNCYFGVSGVGRSVQKSNVEELSHHPFAPHLVDSISFDASLKEDQESLISDSLSNLTCFMSFPVSDHGTVNSIYMADLEDCS